MIMKTQLYKILLCLPFVRFSQKEINIDANFNGRHCRGKTGICSIDTGKNKADTNASFLYSTEHQGYS
jgi:hypothetical protein